MAVEAIETDSQESWVRSGPQFSLICAEELCKFLFQIIQKQSSLFLRRESGEQMLADCYAPVKVNPPPLPPQPPG